MFVMRYLYGPVKSRRLGLSLGVSLTPHKTCSFDCVYCQLGKTTLLTQERKDYINTEEILSELKGFLQNNVQPCDYISLSGYGEPLLNSGINKLIREIKALTSIPVVLITNASLFIEPGARRDVLEADLLVPSLDALTQEVFEKIDRPAAGIRIEDIISGLIALRREFKGKIYLEIMLVEGINDSLEYAYKFKEVIEKINPDKVQLNIPVRSTAEDWVRPPEKERLREIKDILGSRCEII